LQAAVLDMNKVVINISKMLQRLIGEDISLTTTTTPEPTLTKGDPGQIEQVIMNLAVNARDAMPHGGRLTIATSTVDMHQPLLLSHDSVPVGTYVVLEVSDTGEGMDAVTQAKIFDPFFTTKAQGKGTGLGLAIVYGLVKQGNGHIAVQSAIGHGSTFKVYLPKATRESLEVPTAPAASQSLRGTETVLVVEDETVVRAMVTTSLKKRGYQVHAAKDGIEALQILDAQRGRVHLMVTDVVMPGMNGRDLANRILLLHPSIKILYMSGYTSEVFDRYGAQEASGAFLQKPFTQERLARKVREALDR
ncbi:MAG: ATP-binding protein, partial [Nitrospiraceae bacterium]